MAETPDKNLLMHSTTASVTICQVLLLRNNKKEARMDCQLRQGLLQTSLVGNCSLADNL